MRLLKLKPEILRHPGTGCTAKDRELFNTYTAKWFCNLPRVYGG